MPATNRIGHRSRAAEIARLQARARDLIGGGATLEEAARKVGRSPATLHRWGISAGTRPAGRVDADMFGLDGTLAYERDHSGRLQPRVDTSMLPADPDEAAIAYLAMVCDGARSKDDVGFGMADAAAGHLLAAKIGQWDETDRAAASIIAYQHRRQLEEVGLTVPEPHDAGKEAMGAVRQRVLIRENGSDIVVQGKAPPDVLRQAGWEHDRALPGWRAPADSEAAAVGFEAALLARDDTVLGDLPTEIGFSAESIAACESQRIAALESRDCSTVVSSENAEMAAAGDAYWSELRQALGSDSSEAVDEALSILSRPAVPRSKWVDASGLEALVEEHEPVRQEIAELMSGGLDGRSDRGHWGFTRSVDVPSPTKPERMPHAWTRPDGRVEVIFPSDYGWSAASGTALPTLYRTHAAAIDVSAGKVVVDRTDGGGSPRRAAGRSRLRCVFPRGVAANEVIEARRFEGTCEDGLLPAADGSRIADSRQAGVRQAAALVEVLSDPSNRAWMERWKNAYADWQVRDNADRQRHADSVDARVDQCRAWGADGQQGTAMHVTVREVLGGRRKKANTFTHCEVEFPDGRTGEVNLRVPPGSKAPSMAGLKGTQVAVTGEMRPTRPGRYSNTDIRELNGRLTATEWQRL